MVSAIQTIYTDDDENFLWVGTAIVMHLDMYESVYRREEFTEEWVNREGEGVVRVYSKGLIEW